MYDEDNGFPWFLWLIIVMWLVIFLPLLTNNEEPEPQPTPSNTEQVTDIQLPTI